jgi:hypothetical protein
VNKMFLQINKTYENEITHVIILRHMKSSSISTAADTSAVEPHFLLDSIPPSFMRLL